jgi:hypothetical protein
MKTFVARFVRPSGVEGVIHVMASNAVCAMLEAVRHVDGASGLLVRPHRRAALLVPGATPSMAQGGSEPRP